MSKKEIKNILIIGAGGQIGSELTFALREAFKENNCKIIATDINDEALKNIQNNISSELKDYITTENLNVTNIEKLEELIVEYKIDTILNLCAILSAKGENDPFWAWDINIAGLYNVLKLAEKHNLTQVFLPSSIAAFGPETPRVNTKQETITKPKTIYGVCKIVGELFGDYCFHKFGLDVRGIRFPGIISSETLPGGGTTDYAVDIYYKALQDKKYTCFLAENTRLPMMYMPDCIKSIVQLMKTDIKNLKHHCDFNLASMSFTPKEVAESIKKYIPEFEITYEPDERQKIAETWPESIDDSEAQNEWNWKAEYDLDKMTRDMLSKLSKRLNIEIDLNK